MGARHLLVLAAVSVRVSDASFGRDIVLASRTISQYAPGDETIGGGSPLRRSAVSEQRLFALLIHFNRICNSADGRNLADVVGVDRVLYYVPHDSWLVLGRMSALSALRNVTGVAMAEVLPASEKLSSELAVLCRSAETRSVPFALRARWLTIAQRCVICSGPLKETELTIVATTYSMSSLANVSQSIREWPRGTRRLASADTPELVLRISGSDAVCDAIRWVAEFPEVISVDRRHDAAFSNVLTAAMTVQNSRAPSREIWDRGLHGEGQILGVGDTGIDHDNCFFSDPQREVPIDRIDPSHRKIVAYWPDSDRSDAIEGHGTHVVGTAVAASLSTDVGMNRLNGIAWAAKVAFTDVDPQTIPSSLDSYYFERPYSAGARVHCDSWGAQINTYDNRCRTLDRFARLHRDFLSVTAAGNYGPSVGTVSAPCVAKNSLCVGSTTSTPRIFAQVRIDGVATTARPEIFVAKFGRAATLIEPRPLEVIVADPVDACKTLKNPSPAGLRIVLVSRGTCTFTQKAKNVEQLGGYVMLMIDNADPSVNGVVTMDGSDSSLRLGAFSIAGRDGEGILTSLLASGSRLTVELPMMDGSYTGVAAFSGRGPASDGRIKPDLIAPGESIDSVRSDGDINSGQCGALLGLPDLIVLKKSGTSMAAPMVAGSALLVRQYFTEGWYPTGTKQPANQFNPSAALVKAALIHSAQESSEAGGGFGLLDLSQVLFPQNSQQLLVKEALLAEQLETGGKYSVCVSVNGRDTPLKATLVWTDPEAGSLSGLHLVNDLDLAVEHFRCAITGNLCEHKSGIIDANSSVCSMGVWFGNAAGPGSQPDRLNNVERVRMTSKPSTCHLAFKLAAFCAGCDYATLTRDV
jgi:subtilisin family serine protease